jgi:hypothetical protein
MGWPGMIVTENVRMRPADPGTRSSTFSVHTPLASLPAKTPRDCAEASVFP